MNRPTFSEIVEKYTQYDERGLDVFEDWEIEKIAESWIDHVVFQFLRHKLKDKIDKKSWRISLSDIKECCAKEFNKERKSFISTFKDITGYVKPFDRSVEYEEVTPEGEKYYKFFTEIDGKRHVHVDVYTILIDRAYGLITYRSKLWKKELLEIFKKEKEEIKKAKKSKGYIPTVRLDCFHTYFLKMKRFGKEKIDFIEIIIDDPNECKKHLNTIWKKLRKGTTKWKKVAHELRKIYDIPLKLYNNINKKIKFEW